MVEAKKDHPLLFLWNLGTLGIYLIAFGRSGFSSTFGQGRFGLDRICLERPSGTLTALQAKSSVCNCWCILWRSGGYFIAVFFFFFYFLVIINLCAEFLYEHTFSFLWGKWNTQEWNFWTWLSVHLRNCCCFSEWGCHLFYQQKIVLGFWLNL